MHSLHFLERYRCLNNGFLFQIDLRVERSMFVEAKLQLGSLLPLYKKKEKIFEKKLKIKSWSTSKIA